MLRTTAPAEWEPEEESLALKEARDRVENPMPPAEVAGIKIGATGDVAITLSGEIRWPSYMMKGIGDGI
jgi:hypothetical protein